MMIFTWLLSAASLNNQAHLRNLPKTKIDPAPNEHPVTETPPKKKKRAWFSLLDTD